MASIFTAFILALTLLGAGAGAEACDTDAIQGFKDTYGQNSATKYTAAAQAMINASHLELLCANEASGMDGYSWAFRSAKDAGLAGEEAHKGGMTSIAVQFVHTSIQLYQRVRPLAPSVGDRSTVDAEIVYYRNLLQAWSKP